MLINGVVVAIFLVLFMAVVALFCVRALHVMFQEKAGECDEFAYEIRGEMASFFKKCWDVEQAQIEFGKRIAAAERKIAEYDTEAVKAVIGSFADLFVAPETPAPEAPKTDKPVFKFGAALCEIKAGRGMARKGWNGKGMSIWYVAPEGGGKMTLPYIAMRTASGDTVPWLASQTDILADDWVQA